MSKSAIRKQKLKDKAASNAQTGQQQAGTSPNGNAAKAQNDATMEGQEADGSNSAEESQASILSRLIARLDVKTASLANMRDDDAAHEILELKVQREAAVEQRTRLQPAGDQAKILSRLVGNRENLEKT